MKKSHSISFIIILIFLLVFIFFIAPLSIYSYKNFEKALHKNIENYMEQVKNVTQILFEHEALELSDKASEISTLISNTSLDEVKNMDSNIDMYIDDLDLLFIQNRTKIDNFSTSLFDTDLIIEKILKQKIQKGCVQNIVVDNSPLSILLKSKKIINMKSGKVIGEVFVGKILNENLTFLNGIVKKANIKELSLYLNKKIIATTLDINMPKRSIVQNIDQYVNENNLYEESSSIFSKVNLVCEDQSTGVYLIPIVDSLVFKSLKDDYNKQVMILLLFFVIVGFITFFLIRKFIIQPMYTLLDFANHIKTSKRLYKKSIIKEYNTLGDGLENIISELREVKDRYTLAIDGTQEGLWDWNIEEDSIYFSQRCKDMIGFESNDELVLLSQWSERIHKRDKIHVDKKLISHLKKEIGVFEDEFKILSKDGTYKWLEVKAKALYDENGRAYRMLGFFSDIDKLKHLEDENKEKEIYIIEQSKISAMGDMLNNIAHQWRQPLSVITTIVSGIKVQLELGTFDKDGLVKDLDVIGRTSQNLSKTIDSFKDTHELEHIKELFNLNEIILKDLQILEPAYTSKNIFFITNTNNINYFGYKDEFLLMVNKIIQNSKDAIINKKIDKGLIFINLMENNNQILLTIYDNAQGIDESISDKIFEPYFTTKHQAQGVGLSLYVTKNILTKYFDGEIVFLNKNYSYIDTEYKGALFKLKFPKKYEEEVNLIKN